MPTSLRRSPSVLFPCRMRRAAAALIFLQVLTILGFCVFYLIELALGAGADATQTVMSVVTFLVGAGCLALVARGLWRGSAWARTPAVLWNVMVLLICVSLTQSGQWVLAAVVGLVAAGGVATTLAGGGTRSSRSSA